MCFTDYDGPDAYSEDVPRARKPHKCIECFREIQPGELYFRFKGLYEGRWSTFEVCGECEMTRTLIYLAELEEGCHPADSNCPFGGINEALNEGDYKIERPTYSQGQTFLQTKLDQWREKRARYAQQREAYLSMGSGI